MKASAEANGHRSFPFARADRGERRPAASSLPLLRCEGRAVNVLGARLGLTVAATFARVPVSCSALTPMEIVLDERVESHLAGLAKTADRTWGPSRLPALSRADGRWAYNEWRFSGQVHQKIELLDVGRQTGQRYHHRPVSAGFEHANRTVGFWHRMDGATLSFSVKIGPEEACLQLLCPELRLDR